MSSTPNISIDNPSRGASVVEYAMVLSLVLVVLIGAIDALTNTSGQLLDDVGNDIGTPRPYQDVALETQIDSPPAAVPPPVVSSILTWVDRSLATDQGCITVVAPAIGVTSCSSPSAATVNGLSDDGVLLEIALVDGSGCLTGDNGGPTPVVSFTPCDDGPAQDWREESSDDTTVTYIHEQSGLCLQTIVPAAPNPLTLAPCDGSDGQIIEVVS